MADPIDKAPAYVRALRAELADCKAALNEASDDVLALRIYLTSPKFTADWPNHYTVNPDDVLARLPRVYPRS